MLITIIANIVILNHKHFDCQNGKSASDIYNENVRNKYNEQKKTEILAILNGGPLPYIEMTSSELKEDDYNELLVEVSDWWKKHGNIDMLKVLLSEFTNRDTTITLKRIEDENIPYDLISLLKGPGLLKPADIGILIEATNICGLQGVQDVIAKIVKLPNFKCIPFKHFSEHRRKLIAFGQQLNPENMVTIGRLKGIKEVNEDTDPFLLILKLEMKGTLAEGEKMDKFIKLLTDMKMTKEVEALTTLKDLTPVEIQARGPEAVRAFNEALKEGKTEVKQGRVIFVGLEGVGKTSTINALLKKSFNPNHDITDAIATTTVCTQDDVDETTLKEELPDTSSEMYEKAIAREVVKQVKGKQNATASTKQASGNYENAPMKHVKEDRIEEQSKENPAQSTITEESKMDEVKLQTTKNIEQETFQKDGSDDETKIPSKREEELIEIEFQKQGSNDNVTSDKFVMNIWDFGGQPIYHVMQRIFMVSFAVVCIVFNLCDDLDAPAKVLDPTTGEKYDHRMTNLEFILSWIRSIYTNSRPDAKINGQPCPPVLLIGTHLNGLNNQKVKEIKSKIWEALKDKPYETMVCSTIFTIENSVPFKQSNASAIMKQILDLSKKMIRTLPIKWLQVQQEIQILKKKHIYLPTFEIQDEVLKKICKVTDGHKELLEYLHDIGVILYYPDDKDLRDIIVVDLMRLVDMFKTIITVIDHDDMVPAMRPAWRMLDQGILKGGLLKHLWEKFCDSDEILSFFASLMQKFGLVCEQINSKNNEKIFYVLSRLKPHASPPPGFEKKRAVSLFHDFGSYLPDDLFQRAATKFIEKFQMEDKEPVLSYEHVELNIDADHLVILYVTTIKQCRMLQTTIVRTKSFNDSPLEQQLTEDEIKPLPEACKKVLCFLQKELKVFSQSGARGLKVRMCIPCECSPNFQNTQVRKVRMCIPCASSPNTNAHMHVISKFDKDYLPCDDRKMDVRPYRKLFGDELTKELNDDDYNELLTDVSTWWKKHGNIHMLRVLLSEFTYRDTTITLKKIESENTPYHLLGLLEGPGLLKPADIGILVEATNICGLQGVQDVIAKIVKLPNFKFIPFKHFSEHRRKLIAFGQHLNTENMVTIGRLKGIKEVNEDTDSFWLILKLEMKGTLAEGKEMEKFIKLLTERKMMKEVEALTTLKDEQSRSEAGPSSNTESKRSRSEAGP
ncbi:uncharacterized protein [Antedon mediterranea]|uniref:uncharacterized protein n=1 Tax=Antedon mediterranea TaxID=105859 RepID=UPI003AF9DCED